ncbi:aminotransferase class I and II [Acidimicrobium ferrooxidans DSM 10331]|uniref:Aminotransferase n=1 Tax=Acidimicrobium ferrooxidans (strain DSM 10331 / JCM 15462 / NBRC 103882 / ICP) TaxID=525909 RepID=C7M0E6_ACIFD|nr:pyridoxal phosphate-dependent aminotransferase [Acidimicrobium ferrooxidans]ACU54454.1 aminotransferase class I and II [Acidimicrobium ferrooxidans DSM 10331]
MPRGRIATRLTELSPSATLAIDQRAKAMVASGIDVVSFAAGEPDFPTPDFIVEAATAAARDPRNHRYTPAAGLGELRELIVEVTKRDSGRVVSPSNVVVTNGGKHAIYEAMAAIVEPGDEVLIPAPYWVSYPEIVRLFGGVPVAVPTTLANGFKVTPEQVEAAITDRTVAFIHVSPSNPTGAVYSRDESRALAEVLERAGIWVLTDEIYQHLTYTGQRATSLAEVGTEALEARLIQVNGVAKTFAMTGWRVGWIVAPAPVASAVANLQSQLSSNVANVSQRAAIAALEAPLEATAPMRDAFARRRTTIVSALAGIEGLDVLWPDGAFYVFPSLARVLEVQMPSSSALELATRLLEEAHVAVVPGEAFDGPGAWRLSYALGDDALEEGVRRIAEFIGRL